MSLVLGKIHFWLYNKIVWYERLEEDIIRWARKIDLPVEEWKQSLYSQYGMPTENKPLEEIIDTSNIHGWLQQKISNAEMRQAALITEILRADNQYKMDLLKLFSKQGKEAAETYDGKIMTPEEAYNVLNDYVIEGMPCDKVIEILESNEKEFIWQTTTCLHKAYWEKVGGDVQHFYDLRDAWSKAFIETLNTELRYMRTLSDTQKIERKGIY